MNKRNSLRLKRKRRLEKPRLKLRLRRKLRRKLPLKPKRRLNKSSRRRRLMLKLLRKLIMLLSPLKKKRRSMLRVLLLYQIKKLTRLGLQTFQLNLILTVMSLLNGPMLILRTTLELI